MKTLKVDRRKTVVPEDTDILFDEQIQMWIRPAANDIRALRFLHEYKELGVKAGETVLDAGGNIGGFVRWVMAFAAGPSFVAETKSTTVATYIRAAPHCQRVQMNFGLRK
jgi:cyclopropane fatty-acyl-phospholipid synthase-like methyltransferase